MSDPHHRPASPVPSSADPTGPTDPNGDAARFAAARRDPAHRRETVQMYDALAYVLAGPLTFGLAGWAVDAWAGISVGVPLGILGGMALSLYYVWFRYGTQ